MRAWTEDCGASGCIFALDNSGQRTQGGCRHLKDLVGTPMNVRALVREAAAVVVSQRRELEAARAVVEASRRFDEATNPCDLRAGIYAANGSGDEVEPLVTEAYESADALAVALKAYAAAKAGKAVE